MTYVKKLVALPVIALALVFGLSAAPAHAVDLLEGIDEVGSAADIDTNTTLEQTIGQLINVVLGFLGIVFLVLVIYAGFLWMTAAGNTDRVGKAKSIMIQAVIGLIILLAAYAITQFVVTNLGTATGSA